jgi:integrase
MAVMSSAVEDQIITANPLSRLGKKLRLTVKKKGQRVKALDADQLGRFLASARDHEPEHYPILAVMSWGGLRVGEALALTPEKVDFDRQTILVNAQLGGTTKTETDRSVDMATPLVPVLREKLARCNAPGSAKVVAFATGAAERDPTRPEPGPWLFYPALAPNPTPKDEARLYKAVRRAMTRVLKAAGLPGHFTPHSLRHSFGSLLIAAGESPAYVQQQMGHASIQMTVDVYGSWLPVRAAGAVDRLAAATSPDGDRMVTSEGSEARRAVSRQGV